MAKTTFYRPVRNYPVPLPTEAIQIDAPPSFPQKQNKWSSLMQLLYPLSGMMMMGMSMFSYIGMGHGSNPLIIIAEICIMPLSIVIMFLSTFLQQRGVRQQMKADNAAYKGYLDNMQRRLTEIAKLQTQYNTRLYPEARLLPTVVAQRQALWERRPADGDFLSVRIGVAPTLLCSPLEFKEDYKTKSDPVLLQQARDLVNHNSHIDGQPLVISLRQLGLISVVGPRTATRGLVRSMLAQIATFHAPDEARVLLYCPEDATHEWNWLKWLPHNRRLRQVKLEHKDDPEPMAMLANSYSSLQTLLDTQIQPELEQRYKMLNDRRQSSNENPAHRFMNLIFVLDGFSPRGLLEHVPQLEDLMRNVFHLGITIICLVDSRDQEPALLHGRLSISETFGGQYLSFQETNAGGRDIEFITPDSAEIATCEQIARNLTPLNLVDSEADLDFSQDIGLLKLHHLQSVESLHVTDLWRKRDDQQLLRVPIGIQKNGPLYLDLKEMAVGGYGPHGLVVGATGSGKSELLRTVVTSLALTHDPFTVNLVLVDFKAGAAFADFEHLPHVSGIITNLENDPHLISRMYSSLLGEQQRRQNLLSQAGNLSNIRQYQTKWRKNPDTMEPMPYLLIIVDEFAQLIANYEDFLGLFTKFGQVGRSLGMHMMLATQRVDEGRIRTLEGHLRYRIALRTFKPDESTSVIGKPDAYYLPPAPGSGYFKVDEDIYTSFKTALISTPYVPLSEQQVDPRTLFRYYNEIGQLINPFPKAYDTTRSLNEEEPRSEMQMVIEHIDQAPKPARGWRVHAVWQPPLSDKIPLARVLEHYALQLTNGIMSAKTAHLGLLHAPVGMIDRPAEQVQEPLELDFSGLGGHLAIVGAPQAGKSTFLRTLIMSLMVTHTPRDVQIYGIDFGGGLLRVFDQAPHVGAVCNRADRDKIRRVLRRMQQVVVEREALFARYEIDGMPTYRHLRQQGKFANEAYGDVFLLIDNFGQFQNECETSDPESLSTVSALIANGLTYGVHVILTANQWNEIRPKLRSNIGTRLELRLNDPSDSEFDRRAAATIPVEFAGRGLQADKLQFHTALPIINTTNVNDISLFALQQTLEDFVKKSKAIWKGVQAPKVRVLPVEVRLHDVLDLLPDPQHVQGVPIGLEEVNISPVCIDQVHGDPHFLILGDRECGKTTLLRTWIKGIERHYTPEQAKIVLFDYKKTLQDLSHGPHIYMYATAADKAQAYIEKIDKEFEERMKVAAQGSENGMVKDHIWQGLHYFIIVDDYEVFATNTPQNSNPLNDLHFYLPSSKEIGLHMILARRITEMTRSNYDPVFREIRNMEAPGFIMRGDPVEGRQALHKQTPSDAFANGRGFFVRRGTPAVQMQAILTEI